VVPRSLIHSISPAIAVILHGSASTKKSFTCDLTVEFMQKSEFAPSCTVPANRHWPIHRTADQREVLWSSGWYIPTQRRL
jgi:hypothetical protein